MTSPSRHGVESPRRRLRILAGAPFVPWPTTTYSNQVVHAKLAAMASRHEVVFACGVATDADRSNLEALAAATGVTVRGVTAPNSRGQAARVWSHASSISQGIAAGVPYRIFKAGNTPLRRELGRMAASGAFDVVHIDYWYVGRGWVESCPIPSVCYVHDLMFERVARSEALAGEDAAGRLQRALFSRRLPRTELATLATFDALAAISPREATALAELLPRERVAALPAGVDLAWLGELGVPEEPLGVLFVGALASGPNEDGAWAFARHVWPHVVAREPAARLYIVGSGPSARLRALHGHDGVTVTGDVPDVRAWYERCAVVVSPLRWGSGMKGKVLEAMALRRPLVATAVSMEGIAARVGEHYLEAETPQDFVEALCRLFRRPEEGTQVATAARRLVEERYDVASCMRSFLTFVEEIADG
jgi:glycosyltransferase involved in cell wall biosynthesis